MKKIIVKLTQTFVRVLLIHRYQNKQLICTLRINDDISGISLAVKWLRICATKAEGTGSIPGQGTKILCCMVWPKREKKKADRNDTALWI